MPLWGLMVPVKVPFFVIAGNEDYQITQGKML